jgi:DNA-directed RNA polymerase subunit RPC12/RpoP
MNTGKSDEMKKDEGGGKSVGVGAGTAIGFILIAIGIMVSFTVVGLVVGIPMILAGVAYPMIARSLIRGQCPYCGRNVSAMNSRPGIRCPGCGRHIVIRDKKYFEAQA